MKRWLVRQLREHREAARILCSREFWRAFVDYWRVENIIARMDEWTSRTREATGKDPDWDVERRRWARRKKQPPKSDRKER